MREPLLRYLPSYYQEIKEFIALTSAEDNEVQSAAVAVDRLFDDQFVLTSSEEAIRRRERMLNIAADPSTESISFRRTRIVNRYSTKPPFTKRYLQEKLDFIAGVPGLVVVDVDPIKFILQIAVGVENAAVLGEIEYTVDLLKPANLVYQPKTFAAERIGVRDLAYAVGLDRRTGLGTTWRLGISPLAARRAEVRL
ncbi:putative phage tail protein [Cohnella sp. GCM10020058]|uniref:putative phage tail protein n=1 Tax=Cohnella sp. GCM10020058 TaxID=3317330 RepID=UPI0036348144